jgi:hypothetical protein
MVAEKIHAVVPFLSFNCLTWRNKGPNPIRRGKKTAQAEL